MTTFKEIDINEYKKLLDNMQHTYAKTFNNIELLHNFEENVNNKNIDSIIKDKEILEKEDKYIDKLSDKLSEKISNSNINNNNIIPHDDKKKYVFLNTHDYYSKNPKDVLNYIRKIYIKSNIGYDNIYKPRPKTVNISLGNIIKKIENDNKISNELKDDFINAYNNIPNKTSIQFHNKYYREYVMGPVERYYKEKDDEADDEKSIIVPVGDKEDKSLKDELKSNIGKTIVRTLSGQGLNFDKIKIDENLLKKNILKVRYINSNRKINNKILKEDYKISNNMKNSILKNTGLNKLSKNEYDVYNTLQKYRKKDDNLQLLLSSYLAGNENKDLYNKINELLYKNYKNNIINKKQYQNIINYNYIIYIMTELILNSNEHKVDVNKLRYEFKSPIRFDNLFIPLTQAVFYNFFHNVKQNYEMKVKKDNTFYNISL